MTFTLKVSSGGDFDIGYKVVGPNNHVILEGDKEKQADFVFTANVPGTYEFHYSNHMSTVSPKKVDCEIMVEGNAGSGSLIDQALDPARMFEKEGLTDATSKMAQIVAQINGGLAQVSKMQKYFHTRENRNFATVESTEARIFWFAIVDVFLIMGMAGLQVFMVRTFFSSPKKGRI